MKLSRRNFLINSLLGSGALACMPRDILAGSPDSLFFDISLAEWSLHKNLFDKKINNLDFPVITKKKFDIDAVEYVNTFFESTQDSYLGELNKICDNEGVKNLLIMVDREGALGERSSKKRRQSVENHYKWVEAARFLGCHSIRVNARGEGSPEEVKERVVDALSVLCEYAAPLGINVIVENHGGYSSDGKWLSSVIKSVGMENCGTLPDFGNFCVEYKRDADNNRYCADEYDRYKGVKELMPYAKGVSAKAGDFDKNGNVIDTDYFKMLKIVHDFGYKGYIGIEYSGQSHSEYEGIRLTKQLLINTGKAIS
jgi:sugar phosphate isomerase/epimerase